MSSCWFLKIVSTMKFFWHFLTVVLISRPHIVHCPLESALQRYVQKKGEATVVGLPSEWLSPERTSQDNGKTFVLNNHYK